MEHKDTLHATFRLKIVICYRKKDPPPRDRCYCCVSWCCGDEGTLGSLFRSARSKRSQYLGIQPSDKYVGFPVPSGGERGKGGEIFPTRENESFQDL
jgi:hypothetical protein